MLDAAAFDLHLIGSASHSNGGVPVTEVPVGSW